MSWRTPGPGFGLTMRAIMRELPAHRKGLPGTGAMTSPTRTRRGSRPRLAVKWDKPGGFIGRERCCGRNKPGAANDWCKFALHSPEPCYYHNEPIWQGGSLVGFIRSGMYGHTLARPWAWVAYARTLFVAPSVDGAYA